MMQCYQIFHWKRCQIAEVSQIELFLRIILTRLLSIKGDSRPNLLQPELISLRETKLLRLGTLPLKTSSVKTRLEIFQYFKEVYKSRQSYYICLRNMGR
jgi:hypothetical protein